MDKNKDGQLKGVLDCVYDLCQHMHNGVLGVFVSMGLGYSDPPTQNEVAEALMHWYTCNAARDLVIRVNTKNHIYEILLAETRHRGLIFVGTGLYTNDVMPLAVTSWSFHWHDPKEYIQACIETGSLRIQANPYHYVSKEAITLGALVHTDEHRNT